MCGIFSVIGDQSNNASITVLEGLKRLEYRGYDSWGIAVASNNQISLTKKVGKISDVLDLNKLPKSTIAIGHTRWATTGAVTQINAHPHFSSDKSFALAQNGIVENYEELKKYVLKKGFKLISQTDTEVIVRLIEDEFKKIPHLLTAVRNAFLKLTGRNTIILLTKDEKEIIAARNGSPLVIGLDRNGKTVYLSSDALSFSARCEKMIVIDNGQLVHCKESKIKIFNVKTNKEISYVPETIHIHSNKVDKEGFEYFLLKEIHDTPYVLQQVIKQDMSKFNKFITAIKKAKNVYAIGSGTAGVAASQIAFYIRDIAKIKVISLVGADAREYYDLFTKEDIVIAPSQSGETADVLEVLEYLHEKGVKIATYVNMPGSAMTRMADFKFMAKAGPEYCVLSTKVFLSQIAWGYLVAKALKNEFKEGAANLQMLSAAIEKYLDNQNNILKIKKLAKLLLNKKDLFLLGKYQNLNIMREGMIKIIEATYKHAHAIPAGDLKHYAITIMAGGVPVIVALSNDKVKWDVLNAIGEVKLRDAYVIGISPESHENIDFLLKIPDLGEVSAMINIIPLWLLAYYTGILQGHNVDKPRNIAKSVTVK